MSATISTLRAGVIGAGAIAAFRHLPEYAANPDVELVAVADPRLERAQAEAARFGGIAAYADYREMLAAERLDLVSVCTPNYLHAPATIDALEAGVHVLVEKPFATTLDDADAMIAAARRTGRVLMVDQNERFLPVHTTAKRILDSGALGRVLTFRAFYGHSGPENWTPTAAWFFTREQSLSGALGDLGVHKADILRFLLGCEVTEVAAFTGTLQKQAEVNDNAVLLLRFQNGAFGTLAASWTYTYEQESGTVFYCEGGTLRIGAERGRPLVVAMAGPPPAETVYDVPSPEQEQWHPVHGSTVIDAFVESVKDGHAAVPGEEGRAALAVVVAGLQAAETGRTVKPS
jgi:UDP-N-acetylglucosamine 3-dehydrogenase